MDGGSPRIQAIKSSPVMRRALLQGALLAAVLTVLLIARGMAHGGDTDECDVLGGTVVAGQCQIAVPVNATSPSHGGAFEIAQDLHILGTGRIDATGPTGGVTGGITLNIAGDLIIDAPTVANGGQIEANDPGTTTNSASPITINASGELSMAAGSVISASDITAGGSAAPISLDFGGGFDFAGTIAAENPSSGTPVGDGASIDITADGDFRLRDTGLISTNESAGNGNAGPIDVTVGGAMRMDAGSRIRAENTNQAGNGGAITVDVAGDLTMKGAAPPAAGASISSSDTAGNSDAGQIDVTVGGEMTMEAGSRILAENATGGTGGAVTIEVAGDMTMGGAVPPIAGAIISSSSTGGGTNNGGNITIDVGDCSATPPTGDLVIEPGAQVKANAQTAAAGEIDINACHNMEMDGLVESASNQTGTSSTARGGGPIDLVAGCVLTISDEGKVSSRSLDPRADRVHIEGCEVNVFGIVESVARGHAHPDEANGCKGPDRPDKPNGVPLANYPYTAFSSNCVEIWGQNILIDSTGSHNGEVSADSGGGGTEGTGWIDLYAQKNLTIAGNTASPYAVHADGLGGSGGDGEEGGLITAKAQTGTLTASGLAFTAFAGDQGSNSDGGTIVLESNLDLNLGGAIADSGGADLGGRISGRSFNGTVLGTAGGVLDTCGSVRGTETGVQDNVCSVSFPGSVTLQGCGPNLLPGPPNDGVSYAGTTQPTFTQPNDACGGTPSVPTYVVFDTATWARCDPTGRIELQKELDPATDPGLFDLLIDQGTTNVDTEPDATDGDSTGENEVPTGSYEVSEEAGSAGALADYQKQIVCRDADGTGAIVAQTPPGDDPGPLSVAVGFGDDIVCVASNAREPVPGDPGDPGGGAAGQVGGGGDPGDPGDPGGSAAENAQEGGGSLPFTGLQLALMALLGGMLTAGGTAWRRLGQLNRGAAPAPPRTNVERTNVERIEAGLAAHNRGDVDALDELYSPDAAFDARFLAAHRDSDALLAGREIEPVELIDLGDKVIAVVATANGVDAQFALVFTFEDERVVGERAFRSRDDAVKAATWGDLSNGDGYRFL